MKGGSGKGRVSQLVKKFNTGTGSYKPHTRNRYTASSRLRLANNVAKYRPSLNFEAIQKIIAKKLYGNTSENPSIRTRRQIPIQRKNGPSAQNLERISKTHIIPMPNL